MPWGASSVAHYMELAEQLSGLQDLSVSGTATTLLSAVGVIACSTPDLTRLDFQVKTVLDDPQLPQIRSASLKSVTGRFRLAGSKVPPLPVILTFLPECTELRDVQVKFDLYTPKNMPVKGTSVKIRCHCTSERCIMPLDACAGLDEVGVRFLPMPSSQGVQAYTVTFTCHAARPKRALKWDHVVTPGVL